MAHIGTIYHARAGIERLVPATSPSSRVKLLRRRGQLQRRASSRASLQIIKVTQARGMSQHGCSRPPTGCVGAVWRKAGGRAPCQRTRWRGGGQAGQGARGVEIKRCGSLLAPCSPPANAMRSHRQRRRSVV